MSSPAEKIKTVYEKWMELSDVVVGEIIAGELYVSPRPAPKHSNSATGVVDQIRGPFHNKSGGGPGGWVILFEPEIHIDGHIVVPDVAGWTRERMPTLPDEAFFNMAPDWICEILSPSTAVLDRVKKMPLYIEFGVKYFWLVDPLAKTLEVYINDNSAWKLMRTYANEDKVRAVPFELVEILLENLWS